MLCSGCNFSIPMPQAPGDHLCVACGAPLSFQADDFLLHGGLGKEVRPGQVLMGRLIEEAIQKKTVAFIEGPVGIGKSFGYAVPAILADKRVVISTAKKQLQHQLRDELPRLAEILGKPGYTVALLKGKSNYACRAKALDHIKKDGYTAFALWLAMSEFGDITDYLGKPPAFWYETTAEDCIGSRCPQAHKCGYWKAKQQTKVARIVVANHYVVAYDLKFGPKKLLGDYDVLVIDEAHQADSAFRSAYSVSLRNGYLRHLLRSLDAAGITYPTKALEGTWQSAFNRIRDLQGEVPRNPFGTEGDDLKEHITDLEKVVAGELKELGIEHIIDDNGSLSDEDSPRRRSKITDDADGRMAHRLEAFATSLAKTRLTLRDLKEPGDNNVIFIPPSQDHRYKQVTVAPISIGPMIGPKIRSLPTTVITSATIAVNDSFDDIKRRLGLEDPSTPWEGYVPPLEAVLETPFDYNRQALLYTPKDLPLPAQVNNPSRGSYLDSLASRISRLIKASDGNAFILFSSREDMREVHLRILEDDLPNPIVIQGEDAEATFKEFKNTPRSALLGVKSFWEGINVEGSKLELVVITKLPFPNPSEPLIQAQTRQYIAQQVARGMAAQDAEKMVFNVFTIPAMLTDLRQGAGRLIRTQIDRGVLAILDSRIWTGSTKRTPRHDQKNYVGYGAAAVKAIGYSQRTDDFNLVSRYLDMLRRRRTHATEKTKDT